MTYNYRNYELTAFREEDLLSGGDTNLGCGDTFTMPGAATVCIEVSDNDSYLSGDCYDHANDHSGQQASIKGDDGELGNGGQIYAEQYHWVQDTNGNWYVMIEIEQEGSHDDYFTFYTGHGYSVPPAGAELTVHSSCNVSGNWLDYGCMDAGEKVETGSISGTVFCDVNCDGINGDVEIVAGQDYTIEAEDMAEWGFRTVHGSHASDGQLVKLNCAGGHGELSTDFNGNDGVYDVKIRVQDECDGQSTIKLKVNGHVVEAIRLDGDNNGWGSDNGGFSTYVIQDVALNHGDDLSLAVFGDRGEYVRIDKIDLEGEDTTIYTPEPTKAGVTIKLVDAATGDVVATTETDADGNYAFDDVPTGDYKIMGVAPDGTEFTIQDAGGDDTLDSDVDGNGMSDVISVTANSDTDIDLGLKDAPEPGSLSGRYFCDTDGDNQDNGNGNEPGVEGVLVMLLDAAGNPTGDQVFTDANGDYSFGGLDAGTYGVKFTDPNGVLDGKELVDANQGNDASDSDAIGDTTESVINGITVVAGEDTPDNDAGVEESTGAIEGTYFCDEDDDGVQDAGEAGIAGVDVKITGAGADGVLGTGDDTLLTATTDADGNFSVADVAAGDYSIMVGNTMVDGSFTVDPGETETLEVGAECFDFSGSGLFLGDIAEEAANKARFGFPSTLPDDATARGDLSYTAATGMLTGGILLDFLMLEDGSMTSYTNDNAPIMQFDLELDSKGDIAASDAQDLLVFEDANGNGSFDAGEVILLSAEAKVSGASYEGDMDIIFEVTGGDLAGDFDNLLAVQLDNNPTTFTSFEYDFEARPKGFAGDLGYDCYCVEEPTCLELPADGLFGLDSILADAANSARFGFPAPLDGTTRGDFEYTAADGLLAGAVKLDFIELADGTVTTYEEDTAPVMLFDVNLRTNGDILSNDRDDIRIFEDDNGNGQQDAGESVLLLARAVASGVDEVSGDIDFIFEVTGGSLASEFDDLLAMQVDNNPNTFVSLEEDFTGRPKGFVGDLGFDCFCFEEDAIA